MFAVEKYEPRALLLATMQRMNGIVLRDSRWAKRDNANVRRAASMDDNEQQFELSQELEKADRRIRIERLKAEAEEIGGCELVAAGGDEDEDSPIVEEFWQRVVDFESAPRGTRIEQLNKEGVVLPPPESMTDVALHEKLWEVINKLAELRVFLYHTDHLSDRELYVRLWNDLLREETTIMPPDPDSACHLDVIGSGGEEDTEVGLRYYYDDEERAHWRASFPEYPIPDHEDPPYDRDRHLPKRDYGRSWQGGELGGEEDEMI
jgi:hypothetical protein